MDKKDKEIIRILKNNGRAGYNDIGKKVSLSEGAVRKRIKALVDAEVIRKFTVKVGIGEGAEAITLLAPASRCPLMDPFGSSASREGFKNWPVVSTTMSALFRAHSISLGFLDFCRILTLTPLTLKVF